MDKINVIALKQSKKAFINYASLTEIFSNFDRNIDRESNSTIIEMYCLNYGGMPLPSGRWGNALAVALENHHFVSAQYIIEHKEEFNIDTNRISSELGGSNPFSLEEEFNLALSYWDEQEEKEVLDFSKNAGYESCYEAGLKNLNAQLKAIESIKEYIVKEKGGCQKTIK